MKKVLLFLLVCGFFAVDPSTVYSQCTGWGGYVADGDEIPCGTGFPSPPCCEVYNACNGPLSGCNTYDPEDYPSTNGCDLSCTPIDSGVLFLLLGGAAFGGMMIMRRRQEALEVVKH